MSDNTKEFQDSMVPQEQAGKLCWYVVHTYSGYENKVLDTLQKSVENSAEMSKLIRDIRIPMEEVEEIRKGKRVKVQRKIYPGYVMVQMIWTTESWYLVRNTRGVTGFVGPESKPVPLSDAEVEAMLNPVAAEVKRSAERIMRRAYVMGADVTDPGIADGVISATNSSHRASKLSGSVMISSGRYLSWMSRKS